MISIAQPRFHQSRENGGGARNSQLRSCGGGQ